MKNLWLSSIFAFLFFGLVMGTMGGFQAHNVLVGLLVGIFSGAAFTGIILILIFAIRRFRVFGAKEVTGWAPGEVVVRSGEANMMRHALAEGGKLFLTSMRLRFCANRASLEVGDLSFPLASVVSVEQCRTLGIVPNGLRVGLADGRKLQFVVYSPREWIDAIEKLSARST